MSFRTTACSLALILSLGVSAFAQTMTSGTYRSISFEAVEAKAAQSGAFSLLGKAHIKSVDKIAKTTFEADASNVKITFFPASKGQAAKRSGFGAVDGVTMDGPVKIIYTEIDANGNTVKTTATADKAYYNGAEQLAHLSGNVKIVNDNPALYDEPAVITGETAVVNLKPNLGPDDDRYSIKTPSPNRTTIELTTKEVAPKPKAK